MFWPYIIMYIRYYFYVKFKYVYLRMACQPWGVRVAKSQFVVCALWQFSHPTFFRGRRGGRRSTALDSCEPSRIFLRSHLCLDRSLDATSLLCKFIFRKLFVFYTYYMFFLLFFLSNNAGKHFIVQTSYVLICRLISI